MKLLSSSIWIFIILCVLLLIVGLYPTPLMIGLTLTVGSGLVVVQTVIILRDKESS